MKNLFVITDGSRAGKTTLLNALAMDGYKVIPEAARAIICEEVETNGDTLPWKNKQLYTDKMIAASILDYHKATESQPDEICFFDRGYFRCRLLLRNDWLYAYNRIDEQGAELSI